MVRNYRKPLIIIGPKVLLRHPSAVSTMDEMLPGTMFRPVLPDPTVKDPQNVTRLVFMTGKHYYALDKERQTRGISNMAIVRLEVSQCVCIIFTSLLGDKRKDYWNCSVLHSELYCMQRKKLYSWIRTIGYAAKTRLQILLMGFVFFLLMVTNYLFYVCVLWNPFHHCNFFDFSS